MARLQSKHGGMGLRTGLHTAGAQHLSSLAKCSVDISKFIPSWNGLMIAQEDTGWRLERQLEKKIDVGDLYHKIRDGNNGHGNLSIAQKCQIKEAQLVRALMSREELLHIQSNCGPGGAWVRVTPLSWKAWEMKPKQWLVSERRRFSVPIAPYKINCRACKGGWCDVNGEHQVGCAGLGSRIWRHDTIRDILAVEIRNTGYEVTIEQNGGSGLDDRPGDTCVHR